MYVYIYMYMYMYTCVCIYVYVYIYMYIYVWYRWIVFATKASRKCVRKYAKNCTSVKIAAKFLYDLLRRSLSLSLSLMHSRTHPSTPAPTQYRFKQADGGRRRHVEHAGDLAVWIHFDKA